MTKSLIVVFFCLCSLSLFASTFRPESLTPDQWKEDIEFLKVNLFKTHPDPFFKTSEIEISSAIDTLQSRIEGLEWFEIYSEMTRIVALIGDGHTAIHPSPMLNRYPVYPYVFSDGIYIIATDEAHLGLVNTKILQVGGFSTEEAFDRLSVFVAHDNDWGLKETTPNYFITAEIMRAAGLVNGRGELEIMVEKGEEILTSIITPVEGEIKLLQDRRSNTENQTQNENYWYEYCPDSRILHFHFRRCQSQKGKPFLFFNFDMFSFIRKNPVEKLVLDIRQNGGGNSLLLEPFMLRVMFDRKLNREGKLFVAIDRGTFSSAILNAISMSKRTKSIFVGEPTGGSPVHYGEVRKLTLPNSRIQVSCSTVLWKTTSDTSEAFMPDILIERTFEDYYLMMDRVIEAIRSF